MKEIWKDIEGYEGKYFVSNFGNIKNSKNVILKFQDNHGYKRYTLWKDNENKLFMGHVLVARAFIDNDDPVNKIQVNHIDGDKYNNHYTNLEWCTASENQQHARKNNLFSEEGLQRSKQNLIPKAKKKVIKMDEDGNELEIFDSVQEAAASVGCDPSSISKVCRGKEKRVKGFKWKYMD